MKIKNMKVVTPQEHDDLDGWKNDYHLYSGINLSRLIGYIGYQIIDEIISPACNISSVVADLYLADILLYADDEKHAEKILKQVIKRYKLGFEGRIHLKIETPIAFLASYILENGSFEPPTHD